MAKVDPSIRLNKYVSHCGIASRREASNLIKKGSIQVNGTSQIDPAYKVQPNDVITFEGKEILPLEKPVYLAMNKPKKVSTITDDPNIKNVIGLVKNKMTESVQPVDTLEDMTTGVLLLTNDKKVLEKLADSKRAIKKLYHVTLEKPIDDKAIEEVLQSIGEDNPKLSIKEINFVDEDNPMEIMVESHVGTSENIQTHLKSNGLEIKRFDRVFYGGITKKDLQRGWFRHLTQQEVIRLKHFL